MANEKIVVLNDDNFQSEVLQCNLPVLVLFWAGWSSPSRMIAPVIDQFADEYDGRMRLGKLNVDDNQQVADQCEVSSLPTFIIFNDGEIVSRMQGAKSKSQVMAFIDNNI